MLSATAWLRRALAGRTTLAALVPALAAVGLSGCAGPDPAPTTSTTSPVRATLPEPVLAAPTGPGSVGLGTVRPRAVAGGVDPTSAIDSITWRSWGGPTARGRGTGCFVPRGKPVAACVRRPVEVIATRLGTCAGHRAYEDVGWWFPTEGQRFDPSSTFYLRGCAYPPTT